MTREAGGPSRPRARTTAVTFATFFVASSAYAASPSSQLAAPKDAAAAADAPSLSSAPDGNDLRGIVGLYAVQFGKGLSERGSTTLFQGVSLGVGAAIGSSVVVDATVRQAFDPARHFSSALTSLALGVSIYPLSGARSSRSTVRTSDGQEITYSRHEIPSQPVVLFSTGPSWLGATSGAMHSDTRFGVGWSFDLSREHSGEFIPMVVMGRHASAKGVLVSFEAGVSWHKTAGVD